MSLYLYLFIYLFITIYIYKIGNRGNRLAIATFSQVTKQVTNR